MYAWSHDAEILHDVNNWYGTGADYTSEELGRSRKGRGGGAEAVKPVKREAEDRATQNREMSVLS